MGDLALQGLNSLIAEDEAAAKAATVPNNVVIFPTTPIEA